MKNFILTFSLLLLVGCGCQKEELTNIEKAKESLDSLYCHYRVDNTYLLRENYPFDEKYRATYLNTENSNPNEYAYLWPYSGTLSAVNALYIKTGDQKYLDIIENNIMKGLDQYFDENRKPSGYASYINTAPQSDRFYDDNVWIGIDFTEIYLHTKNGKYLEKAKEVWNFVYSGHDELLGGGIYWVESDKATKNTCSNAPAVVFALKLFQATQDEEYKEKAISLYNWTKTTLQDPADHLYFDNIGIDNEIHKVKYAYNSGQIMQASAILYQITKDEQYLKEAQILAEACHNYFFHDIASNQNSFKILSKGNIWFSSIMSRGFLELYEIDQNPEYIISIQKSLDHAWLHMRDSDGLFDTDWEGAEQSKNRWLLTQLAMVEMYAKF